MFPSKRIRITVPPGFYGRLETCAFLAGVPVMQEASMLLCASIRLAEVRFRQLEMWPEDRCERCGATNPSVHPRPDLKLSEAPADRPLALCDDCASLVATWHSSITTAPTTSSSDS